MRAVEVAARRYYNGNAADLRRYVDEISAMQVQLAGMLGTRDKLVAEQHELSEFLLDHGYHLDPSGLYFPYKPEEESE